MERPDGGSKETEEKGKAAQVHAYPRQEAAAAVTASTTAERSDLVRKIDEGGFTNQDFLSWSQIALQTKCDY